MLFDIIFGYTLTLRQESTLPQLQSMIIVLMKGVLMHVTACISLPNGQQQHPGMPVPNNRINGGPGINRPLDNGNGINGVGNGDFHESSLEDLDSIRAREIESKAATGIILLLLKWLKISRKQLVLTLSQTML